MIYLKPVHNAEVQRYQQLTLSCLSDIAQTCTRSVLTLLGLALLEELLLDVPL